MITKLYAELYNYFTDEVVDEESLSALTNKIINCSKVKEFSIPIEGDKDQVDAAIAARKQLADQRHDVEKLLSDIWISIKQDQKMYLAYKNFPEKFEAFKSIIDNELQELEPEEAEQQAAKRREIELSFYHAFIEFLDESINDEMDGRINLIVKKMGEIAKEQPLTQETLKRDTVKMKVEQDEADAIWKAKKALAEAEKALAEAKTEAAKNTRQTKYEQLKHDLEQLEQKREQRLLVQAESIETENIRRLLHCILKTKRLDEEENIFPIRSFPLGFEAFKIEKNEAVNGIDLVKIKNAKFNFYRVFIDYMNEYIDVTSSEDNANSARLNELHRRTIELNEQLIKLKRGEDVEIEVVERIEIDVKEQAQSLKEKIIKSLRENLDKQNKNKTKSKSSYLAILIILAWERYLEVHEICFDELDENCATTEIDKLPELLGIPMGFDPFSAKNMSMTFGLENISLNDIKILKKSMEEQELKFTLEGILKFVLNDCENILIAPETIKQKYKSFENKVNRYVNLLESIREKLLVDPELDWRDLYFCGLHYSDRRKNLFLEPELEKVSRSIFSVDNKAWLKQVIDRGAVLEWNPHNNDATMQQPLIASGQCQNNTYGLVVHDGSCASRGFGLERQSGNPEASFKLPKEALRLKQSGAVTTLFQERLTGLIQALPKSSWTNDSEIKLCVIEAAEAVKTLSQEVYVYLHEQDGPPLISEMLRLHFSVYRIEKEEGLFLGQGSNLSFIVNTETKTVKELLHTPTFYFHQENKRSHPLSLQSVISRKDQVETGLELNIKRFTVGKNEIIIQLAPTMLAMIPALFKEVKCVKVINKVDVFQAEINKEVLERWLAEVMADTDNPDNIEVLINNAYRNINDNIEKNTETLKSSLKEIYQVSHEWYQQFSESNPERQEVVNKFNEDRKNETFLNLKAYSYETPLFMLIRYLEKQGKDELVSLIEKYFLDKGYFSFQIRVPYQIEALLNVLPDNMIPQNFDLDSDMLFKWHLLNNNCDKETWTLLVDRLIDSSETPEKISQSAYFSDRKKALRNPSKRDLDELIVSMIRALQGSAQDIRGRAIKNEAKVMALFDLLSKHNIKPRYDLVGSTKAVLTVRDFIEAFFCAPIHLAGYQGATIAVAEQQASVGLNALISQASLPKFDEHNLLYKPFRQFSRNVRKEIPREGFLAKKENKQSAITKLFSKASDEPDVYYSPSDSIEQAADLIELEQKLIKLAADAADHIEPDQFNKLGNLVEAVAKHRYGHFSYGKLKNLTFILINVIFDCIKDRNPQNLDRLAFYLKRARSIKAAGQQEDLYLLVLGESLLNATFDEAFLDNLHREHYEVENQVMQKFFDAFRDSSKEERINILLGTVNQSNNEFYLALYLANKFKIANNTLTGEDAILAMKEAYCRGIKAAGELIAQELIEESNPHAHLKALHYWKATPHVESRKALGKLYDTLLKFDWKIMQPSFPYCDDKSELTWQSQFAEVVFYYHGHIDLALRYCREAVRENDLYGLYLYALILHHVARELPKTSVDKIIECDRISKSIENYFLHLESTKQTGLAVVNYVLGKYYFDSPFLLEKEKDKAADYFLTAIEGGIMPAHYDMGCLKNKKEHTETALMNDYWKASRDKFLETIKQGGDLQTSFESWIDFSTLFDEKVKTVKTTSVHFPESNPAVFFAKKNVVELEDMPKQKKKATQDDDDSGQLRIRKTGSE